MRYKCSHCKEAVTPQQRVSVGEHSFHNNCGGRVDANPKAYRVIPMIVAPHPSTKKRLREPMRQCVVCHLAMRGAPRFWLHLVDGGTNVVHNDEGREHEYDPDVMPGDCGLHEVGPDCARRFRKDYVVDRRGCVEPRAKINARAQAKRAAKVRAPATA